MEKFLNNIHTKILKIKTPLRIIAILCIGFAIILLFLPAGSVGMPPNAYYGVEVAIKRILLSAISLSIGFAILSLIYPIVASICLILSAIFSCFCIVSCIETGSFLGIFICIIIPQLYLFLLTKTPKIIKLIDIVIIGTFLLTMCLFQNFH